MAQNTTQDVFLRRKPEELGIDPAGVLAFLQDVKAAGLELHSFMLLRHGKVAAEAWWKPYSADRKHMLFSLSKSFTSTAIGIAVSEKLLQTGDTVASFFPELMPDNPSEYVLGMTVRDLLMMSSGHETDPVQAMTGSEDGNWARAFLHAPVLHPPGTRFLYNNGATYMLSAILQRVTGMTLVEYLKPRLFGPLGIKDPEWEVCPRGIAAGGWGLKLRTGEIAAFGQLYLQEGVWNGRQLVAKEWIAEATSKQIENGTDPDSDWAQGYGYQFWRCRHGMYRGDGAYGQLCIVLPELDSVIAVTSGVEPIHEIVNRIWQHLLPAIQTGLFWERDKRLAEDQKALEQVIEELEYTTPEGFAQTPAGLEAFSRSYRLEGHEDLDRTIAFHFGEENEASYAEVDTARGAFRIPLSGGGWQAGTVFRHGKRENAVSSAGWRDDETLEVTFRLLETPFAQRETYRFSGNRLTLTVELNCNMASSNVIQLEGAAV